MEAVTITLIMTVAVAGSNVSLAQKKEPPRPAVTKEAVKPKLPPAGEKPPVRIFVPKEKVSAGKPVSFPSDI